MEFFKVLLEQNQLMTLFLVIALGYAIGAVNIRGFSLGVGAVLFVGLAVGALAPKAAPPGLIGSLGLVMFLYGIGIQYGKQFFAGLSGASGQRYNLVAVIALMVAAGIVWAAGYLLQLPAGYVAGLFAGSGTSTATLQAAMEAAGNNNPAIGYSVAYPFGVIGPILCMYVAMLLVKPQIEAPSGTGLDLSGAVVRNPELIGKTVSELAGILPRGVQIIAVRQQQVNKVPRPDMVIEEDNVIALVADDKNSLQQAMKLIGEAAEHGRMAKDRKDLDYVRLFASKPTVVGCRLADLRAPGGAEYSILHVRRGDADLLPAPDLILEFGDRVGMFLNRANLPNFRKYFGDSIKGYHRIQLCVDRHWHGPRGYPRADKFSSARRGLHEARFGGRTAPGVTHTWKTWSNRPDGLDHARFSEPDPPQFRTNDLPGSGGNDLGRKIRHDSAADRPAFSRNRCRDPVGNSADHPDIRPINAHSFR